VATRVTEDPVGGDIDVKAGDWLVAVSPVALPNGEVFYYYPPQPVAFNLIEAKRHRDRGSKQRRTIMGNLTADPHGRLMPTKSDAVMDCLSDLVGAVLHAFTAIESFANHSIDQLPEDAVVEAEREKVQTAIKRDGMVRRLNLSEKLDQVIPLHDGATSPKGTAAWEKYVHLKRLRDDLVHVKARGYSSVATEPSAYGKLLLGAGDDCVEEAVALIKAARPEFLDERVLDRLNQ
jgi:hypothetical protein